MPCDQIQKVGVTLEKCDATTMLAALTEMKLNPRQVGDLIHFGNREFINTKTGQASLLVNRSQAEIRQAYSTQIVKQTAKKFGWTLKQTGPNQFQTLKR